MRRNQVTETRTRSNTESRRRQSRYIPGQERWELSCWILTLTNNKLNQTLISQRNNHKKVSSLSTMTRNAQSDRHVTLTKKKVGTAHDSKNKSNKCHDKWKRFHPEWQRLVSHVTKRMKYKVPHEKQQKQVDKEKNKKTGKNEDEMKRKVTHSQNEKKTKNKTNH